MSGIPSKVLELVGDKKAAPTILLCAAVYMGMWVSHIEDQLKAHAEDIGEVKKAQVEYNKHVRKIDTNIALIKQKLNINNHVDDE